MNPFLNDECMSAEGERRRDTQIPAKHCVGKKKNEQDYSRIRARKELTAHRQTAEDRAEAGSQMIISFRASMTVNRRQTVGHLPQ